MCIRLLWLATTILIKMLRPTLDENGVVSGVESVNMQVNPISRKVNR
jgi:hypothetical protein